MGVDTKGSWIPKNVFFSFKWKRDQIHTGPETDRFFNLILPVKDDTERQCRFSAYRVDS